MADSRKVVYILGAGVDRPLGMPLATELLNDVAAFASGPGNRWQMLYVGNYLIFDSASPNTPRNKEKLWRREFS